MRSRLEVGQCAADDADVDAVEQAAKARDEQKDPVIEKQASFRGRRRRHIFFFELRMWMQFPSHALRMRRCPEGNRLQRFSLKRLHHRSAERSAAMAGSQRDDAPSVTSIPPSARLPPAARRISAGSLKVIFRRE